jgi:hypothetical protein
MSQLLLESFFIILHYGQALRRQKFMEKNIKISWKQKKFKRKRINLMMNSKYLKLKLKRSKK